jgi:undecaprenyl-diphosphatase
LAIRLRKNLDAVTMEELSTCLRPSFEFRPVGDSPAVMEPGIALETVAGAAEASASRVSRFAVRFSAAELKAVHVASHGARRPIARALAIAFSWLGNGWIYPLLAALIFAKWGALGMRIAAPAAANATLLHCFYPLLKKRCGRQRPFEADPRLKSLLNVLDKHSFPSGHAMTLAGVLTPIVMLWPAATLFAIVAGGCVAWSRIATAHHYPSDVVAGAVLGVGVGYPTTACLVSLWS